MKTEEEPSAEILCLRFPPTLCAQLGTDVPAMPKARKSIKGSECFSARNAPIIPTYSKRNGEGV